MRTTEATVNRESNGLFLAVPSEDFGVGLHGEGRTPQAAMDDLRQVYEEAREFAPSLPETQFEPVYDITALFDAYPWLNASRMARELDLSPSLMRQYRAGQYVSQKRRQQIEAGLHRLGQTLCAARIGKAKATA